MFAVRCLSPPLPAHPTAVPAAFAILAYSAVLPPPPLATALPVVLLSVLVDALLQLLVTSIVPQASERAVGALTLLVAAVPVVAFLVYYARQR